MNVTIIANYYSLLSNFSNYNLLIISLFRFHIGPTIYYIHLFEPKSNSFHERTSDLRLFRVCH